MIGTDNQVGSEHNFVIESNELILRQVCDTSNTGIKGLISTDLCDISSKFYLYSV